jgi:hypothetical protein
MLFSRRLKTRSFSLTYFSLGLNLLSKLNLTITNMNNNPTNNSLPNKDIQEEDLSHLKNYDLYKRLLEVFPEETRLTLRQTRLVDKDRKKFDRMLPFLAELTTTNNQNQIVNAFIDILLTFPDSGE